MCNKVGEDNFRKKAETRLEKTLNSKMKSLNSIMLEVRTATGDF